MVVRWLVLVLLASVPVAGCLEGTPADSVGDRDAGTVPSTWDGFVPVLDADAQLAVRLQPGQSGGAFLMDVDAGAWGVHQAGTVHQLTFNTTVAGAGPGEGSSVLFMDVTDGRARFLEVVHDVGDFNRSEVVAEDLCLGSAMRVLVVWTTNARSDDLMLLLDAGSGTREVSVTAYGDPRSPGAVAGYRHSLEDDMEDNVEVRDGRTDEVVVPTPIGGMPLVAGGALEVEARHEGAGLFFVYAWDAGGSFLAAGDWTIAVEGDGPYPPREGVTQVPARMDEVLLVDAVQSSLRAQLTVRPTTGYPSFWLFYVTVSSIDPSLLEGIDFAEGWTAIERPLLYAPEPQAGLVDGCSP